MIAVKYHDGGVGLSGYVYLVINQGSLSLYVLLRRECTHQRLKHFDWDPAGFMSFLEVIAVVYRDDNHMGLTFHFKASITTCIFCI